VTTHYSELYGSPSLQEIEGLAGNWKKFKNFMWWSQTEDAHNWVIFHTGSRDDHLSYHGTIDKEMEKLQGGGDVQAEKSHHWALGWAVGWSVRVFSDREKGEVTPAFKKAWLYLKNILDRCEER